LKLKEYALLMEYKALRGRVESGVYVIPGFESLLRWYGAIFIHEGDYNGGTFKFTIFLPDTYPKSGNPRLRFETKIFHPLIHASTRELDLTPAKLPTDDSGATRGYMQQLLRYVKEVFYFHEKYWKVEAKEPTKIPCFSSAAAKLYSRDRTKYRAKCKECVRESLERMKIGADPESSLSFGPYMDSHEVVRDKILKGTKLGVTKRGSVDYLRWFSSGAAKSMR